MPLYINTNVSSLEAQRNLNATQNTQNRNFQRLSSGLRINSAADDAAGLAISESLRSQTRSYSVAERNTNNAVSMAQTAEGALGQVSNILGRMRELAVQSANGDLTSTDRGYLQTEYSQLTSEITRIIDSTKYNGKDLLGGTTASTIDFQVGIGTASSDQISVSFGGNSLSSLGLSGSVVSGADATNSRSAINAIDSALASVSNIRATFGAVINRFETTVSNIQSIRTNFSAATSRIRDVDVAEETAALARNQVLQQAGVSILAQANQAPQLALSLLR
jgi:flagellin